MRARRSKLLSAALAGLLLVIGFSALAVWWNTKSSQQRVAALQQAHMRVGLALAEIRETVYLNAVLKRDYLLDSDPESIRQYIDQFAGIRARTDEAFRVLEAAGQDQEQTAALSRLRGEINAYWDPTEVALDWSPEEKNAQKTQMLRQSVRRRQEIFALSQQVERMIAANFARERERITTADQEFRSSLAWTTGIALLLGFVIAGGTLVRMLELERQSQNAESQLRLLSGQLRTAQEQERKHLSRELHDQVGQMLTGLRMELANVARLQVDPASEATAAIVRAKGAVEQTLRVVRNISMLLRPSMLDDLGLTPALAWLFKEVSRSNGFEIRSDVAPGLDTLPEAHRTCIYRIVQEALTNASRHSGCRIVRVSLSSSGGWVTGTVADDGRGFEKSAGRSMGLGLLGMQERVSEIGGAVQVISAPGQGTRVEFRLAYPVRTEVESATDSDRGRSRDHSDRIEASA